MFVHLPLANFLLGFFIYLFLSEWGWGGKEAGGGRGKQDKGGRVVEGRGIGRGWDGLVEENYSQIHLF